MSDLLLGMGQNEPEQGAAAREAARAVSLSKVPLRQAELTKIQNTFIIILREMKQNAGSNLEPSKSVKKEIIEKMVADLNKGQEALSPSIMPEQITDAILHTVDDAALPPETLTELRGGLVSLFESLPRINDTHDQ